MKLIEWIIKLFGRVPHRIRKIRFDKRMDNLMKTADMEKK